MRPKQTRSAITAANVERLQHMLRDLADADGTVQEMSIWALTIAFNQRYTGETKPIGYSTMQRYIVLGITAGWLSSKQASGSGGRLVLTLLCADRRRDVG